MHVQSNGGWLGGWLAGWRGPAGRPKTPPPPPPLPPPGWRSSLTSTDSAQLESFTNSTWGTQYKTNITRHPERKQTVEI